MTAPTKKSEVLYNAAEKLFHDKQWEAACIRYDQYFSNAFDKDNITIDVAKALIHYARALIESSRETSGYSEDDMSAAAEYLITARVALSSIPNTDPDFVLYIEVLQTLAEVSTINHQYKTAATNLTQAVELAENSPVCDWRLRASLRFLLGVAYENREMPRDGITHLDIAISIISKKIEENPEDSDIEQYKQMIEDIEARKKDLIEDATEQEANKDIINDKKEEEEEDEKEEQKEDVKVETPALPEDEAN